MRSLEPGPLFTVRMGFLSPLECFFRIFYLLSSLVPLGLAHVVPFVVSEWFL